MAAMITIDFIFMFLSRLRVRAALAFAGLAIVGRALRLPSFRLASDALALQIILLKKFVFIGRKQG